jgi:hypothetical protein
VLPHGASVPPPFPVVTPDACVGPATPKALIATIAANAKFSPKYFTFTVYLLLCDYVDFPIFVIGPVTAPDYFCF